MYTSSMCGSPQTATALAQITSWSEKKVYFKLHESGVLFPIKEVKHVLNMQIAHYTHCKKSIVILTIAIVTRIATVDYK